VMAKAIAADGVEIMACDGLASAADAASERIALIVADVASAGGWDGVAALLALPVWSGRSVPVLALVQGAIDAAGEEQAAALGITRILSRPMSAATLRAAVSTMMPVPPGAGSEPQRVAA